MLVGQVGGMTKSQKEETDRLVAERHQAEAAQNANINAAVQELTNEARAEHAQRMHHMNVAMTQEREAEVAKNHGTNGGTKG